MAETSTEQEHNFDAEVAALSDEEVRWKLDEVLEENERLRAAVESERSCHRSMLMYVSDPGSGDDPPTTRGLNAP